MTLFENKKKVLKKQNKQRENSKKIKLRQCMSKDIMTNKGLKSSGWKMKG